MMLIARLAVSLHVVACRTLRHAMKWQKDVLGSISFQQADIPAPVRQKLLLLKLLRFLSSRRKIEWTQTCVNDATFKVTLSVLCGGKPVVVNRNVFLDGHLCCYAMRPATYPCTSLQQYVRSKPRLHLPQTGRCCIVAQTSSAALHCVMS